MNVRLKTEEVAMIRKISEQEARRNGGKAPYTMELGERVALKPGTHETSFNIYLLTEDRTGDWDGTDLNQTYEWKRIREKIELSHDGLAMIDFYIYERTRDGNGDLICNSQALIDEKGLKQIQADGVNRVLWSRD